MFLFNLNDEILILILKKLNKKAFLNFRITSLNFNNLSFNYIIYFPLILKTTYCLPRFIYDTYCICDCSINKLNYNPTLINFERKKCIFSKFIHESREIKLFIDECKEVRCEFIKVNDNIKNYPKDNFFKKIKQNFNNNLYLYKKKKDQRIILLSKNKNLDEEYVFLEKFCI